MADAKKLIQELQEHIKEESPDDVIETADKLLRLDPNDKEAFGCKVVALIHNSEFAAAAKLIQSHATLKDGLVFEYAYCLFRQQKLDEALTTLRNVASPDARHLELMAQTLYRMERYEDSLGTYARLQKAAKDGFALERQANVLADHAAAATAGDKKALALDPLSFKPSTYEMHYNAATLALARRDLPTALRLLDVAGEQCKKALLEDEPEMTEEELAGELGLVNVQSALVQQLQGRGDEAAKQYAAVLKAKPDDAAMAAVAANNIIAHNKDRDLFDSKKKLKLATAEAAQSKLTSLQRRAIEANHCLVLLHANQADACRRKCDEIQALDPASDVPHLVRAALQRRGKDVPLQALKEAGLAHKSARVLATVVQLRLAMGDAAGARADQ